MQATVPSNLKQAVDPTTYKKKALGSADETAIARRQWERYVRARDSGHLKYVEEAQKFSNFYRGAQWDPADLKLLAEENRPALTINMILSTVNVLIGEQSNRRVDMRYKPRDDTAMTDARALTKMSMAICDANKFDWLESEAFADGVIEDRGYFDLRMAFDDNIQGDAVIDTIDPKEVLPDPDASSWDPDAWNEVTVTRWYSLDDVEVKFGSKARKKLESMAGQSKGFGKDSIRWDYPQKDTFGDPDESVVSFLPDDEDSEGQLRSVRVLDRQYYRLVEVFCLVNPQTGALRQLPVGYKRTEAEAYAKKLGLPLHKKTVKKIRWTVTADQFVLHDSWSPYRSFTIVPYFPYFRRGRPFGLVRNLISPQEQLNKITSQELHIINSTANSGWVVERGSLVNMTADELAGQGSKTGLVIEYAPGRQAPEKIKSNTVPTGIERFGQKAHAFFRDISGVNNAMLGMESAEVSGVALEEKKSSGLIQVQVPMDSLAKTRHMVARKLMELIQDFYTEERIINITHDQEPGAPTEKMVINQVQSDGSVLNDVTVGKYEIVISTMPSRDNFGDVQFGEALSLRREGVMIPDHHVIMYSNLTNKAAVAEEVKNLQGLGEKSPEQQATEQMLQQLQIDTAKAELRKLEETANQLRSLAELNYAKAGETSESTEFQLRELEQAMAKAREEIAVRERLAELSAINKMDVQRLQGEQALALEKAKPKPAPTKK